MIDYEQRALDEAESLRRQNAKLTRELGHAVSLARAMHAQRKRDEAAKPRRCAYCGDPSVGPACRAHSDLLELDEVLK